MKNPPPANPSNPPPVPLFRREALEALAPPQYGQIVLLPGASSRWLALAALCVVLALAALIGWGSYTRRSTVSGQLYPDEGLIRVTAAQPGVVVEQKVRDGQAVRRGDVLFVLSGDRVGPDAQDYQRGIASQIEARQRSLEDELRRLAGSERLEAEQLRRRITALQAERVQVTRQAGLQGERIAGAEDAVRRYQGLAEQGYVSRDELLTREAELGDLRGRLEGHRRDALAIDGELAVSQRDLDSLRLRYDTQRAELERAVMLTRQEFTEIEARRRVVVTAPADGQITLVQAEVGQSVDPAARPLAHLVPAAATLVARLYAPSRAAGFVKPGATVLLRYDAFPYQKFGQQVGRVESVSAAAAVAADLRGYTAAPETTAEPMFAITVKLPEQTIGAIGQRMPLQTGMRVDADLLHETRRLYEWILEPLYAARARVENS
jgi:membrane fusion protein